MDAHFEEADWTFLTVPSSGYQWEDSSSAGSTPRLRASARLPSTSDPSLKRPRLQRRHSPEATYLLSLVHQQEPIRVPVPPSLQAKGRRLSDRTVSHHQPDAWYDYNEFGASGPSPVTTTNNGRSSSPTSSSGRLSSRSSVSALRKEPASVLGDAGLHAPHSKPYGAPGTPPRPALIAKNINNFPPPLSLPSPVIVSRSPQ